jgi:hypothetical protein
MFPVYFIYHKIRKQKLEVIFIWEEAINEQNEVKSAVAPAEELAAVRNGLDVQKLQRRQVQAQQSADKKTTRYC